MTVTHHRRADDGLTYREVEILQLVATGMSNQEIALQLMVSERTVRTHVSNILSKLLVDNRTQAALVALENGYADVPVVNPYSHRNGEAELPTIAGAFWAEWPDPLERDLVLIARAPWGEWKMRRSAGEWTARKAHRWRMAGVRFWGPIPEPFDNK